MRPIVSTICLCLCAYSGAFAQSTQPEKLKNKQVSVSSKPVSEADVYACFSRLESGMSRIFKLPPRATANKGTTNPATRTLVIARMKQLLDLVRSEFKFTPRPIPFDPKVITIKQSEPLRKSLERMIAWGFVDKVGPLATEKSATLTAIQFGDALGLFIARIADLTHLPDSKFSPYLSGDGG